MVQRASSGKRVLTSHPLCEPPLDSQGVLKTPYEAGVFLYSYLKIIALNKPYKLLLVAIRLLNKQLEPITLRNNTMEVVSFPEFVKPYGFKKMFARIRLS